MEITDSPRSESTALTRTAYDAESGEHLPISPDMVRRATQMQRYMEMAVLVQAAALRTIADEKLYLALGCSSFKEYAETATPFGLRTAKRYLSIGRRLTPLLPGLPAGDGANVPPVAFDSEPESHNFASQLGEIGISKLEFLTRLDDDELEHLAEEGEVRFPSGKTVTLEGYREMTRAEIQREFKAEKKALRERAQAQEEAAKLAASERDALEAENERLRQDLSDTQRDAMLHGPAAAKIQEKRARLEASRTSLDEFRFAFVRSGVNVDDPEELQLQAMELIRYVQKTAEDMLVEFNEVVAFTSGLHADA